MAASDLEEIMRRVDALSLQEQIRLLDYLSQKALPVEEPHPRRKWREVRAIAPNLMGGEDAQEWVSRTRREAQEHRDQLLRDAYREDR